MPQSYILDWGMLIRRLKRVFRKIPLRLLIGVLLVVFVLSGGVYGGLWGYGKILNRQARGLIASAEEDFHAGKLTEARMGVETALRIKPDLTAASRLLARIQTMAGENKAALKTLQALAEQGGLSLEELKIYSSLAFQNSEDALARRLSMIAGDHGDPAFPHLIAAQIAMRDSKPDEAEKFFRDAVDAAPSDATRAFLVDFLLSVHPSRNATEITEIITDFSSRKNELGAMALAAGLQTGLVPSEDRKKWIEALRSHPRCSTRQRLLAETSALALDPALKPQIVSELHEYAKALPLKDRVSVAEWFLRNGEPKNTTILLPLADSIAQSSSFMLWLDAVTAQGNWTVALDALSKPESPLPPLAAKLFRGLALKRTGETANSQAVFREAILDAGSDPKKSTLVASYLLAAEENELFGEVFPPLSENRLNAHLLYSTLYPAVLARNDPDLSLRVLEALSKSRLLSENIEFQTELAYYQILFGKPADLDFLKSTRKSDPNNLPVLSLLAFHELKSGAPRTAKAIFDSFEPDVDARVLPPRIVAIFSATLAANGDLNGARKAASIIPTNAFSKQEEALLSFPRFSNELAR